MFLEILVLGIFISITVFNVIPVSKIAAERSDDAANYSDTLDAIEIERIVPTDGWIEVFKSDQFSFYANPASIRKKGHKVKMWRLTDHKTAEINGEFIYLSKKLLEEYDCKTEQARQLDVTLYDENMGIGKAAYTNSATYIWEPVTLHADSEAMWEFACETK